MDEYSIGRVITFYSYKGGVGRSMALANVAVLLARLGKKVLVVDWDLEAPGLENYLGNEDSSLLDKVRHTPGILELLTTKYVNSEAASWMRCVIKVNFIKAELSFISSGRKDDKYGPSLQNINWPFLFAETFLGERLERMESEMKKAYDFILVDSRTGVTDVGDICTAILADVLVLMFVTNSQNLDGVSWIAQRAQRVREGLPTNPGRLITIPILGRDETYNEYERSMDWKRRHSRQVEILAEDWVPKGVSGLDILQKLFVPYVAHWSFDERLPVVDSPDEIRNPASISAAYGRIANILAHELAWSALEERAYEAEREQDKAKIAELEQQESFKIYESRVNRRVHLLKTSTFMMLVIFFSILTVSTYYQRQLAQDQRKLAELALSQAEYGAQRARQLEKELYDTRAMLDDASKTIKDLGEALKKAQ